MARSTTGGVLVLAIAAAGLLAGCGSGKLSVGDPAPPLTVSKWLKGEQILVFATGKVHVVEFWASWCGPCRAVVPHLSALQKKHADVVFLGVNVWERNPADGVAFVQGQGDRMDYRVAQDDLADGPDKGKMATAWLKAAGRNGIPCAFVVDGKGRIAWIGHPMDPGMEKAVEAAKR
jgi:thiol-disulfide isomerase/thioredoxin